MRLSKLCLFIALLLSAHAFSQPVLFPNWTVSEHQPHVQQGGRTNSVAVNPSNPSEMFATSDSGGLFRTRDGGATWMHIDSLPVIFTQAVAYVPVQGTLTTTVVLVSAKADLTTINGGGIWRSDDNGDTWTHVLVDSTGVRSSAYGIAVAGHEVVAATSEGVSVSSDDGITWTQPVDIFGNADRRVFSVALIPGNPSLIYAAGPLGVKVGTIPLNTWTPSGSFNDIQNLHALGRSTLSVNDAFLAYGKALYRTEDRGVTWKAMTAPQDPDCAGTPFIKTTRTKRDLFLYYGNGCGLYQLTAPVSNGMANYSGQWTTLLVDSPNTRDLAFYGVTPALLATNAGVHTTSDAGFDWTLSGGGIGGYDALQVTDIKGQYVADPAQPRRHVELDLYVGTRDNNVWALSPSGVQKSHLVNQGIFIEAERNVPSDAESKITLTLCNGPSCQPTQTKRQLNNPLPVHHGAQRTSALALVRRGFYIQRSVNGLDFTVDPNMASWSPFAVFGGDALALPKVAYVGPGDESWVYQPFRTGSTTKLLQIHHMNGVNDFETPVQGLNAVATMQLLPDALLPVYAVDSWDPKHVMVSELNSGVMNLPGTDNTWHQMPELNTLVTNGGARQLYSGVPEFSTLPIVTAISFNPDNATQVLLGTVAGGIYYSSDRGAHWALLAGSEHTTFATSFYWASLNTVYVGTFGRGVWLLHNVPMAPPEAFDQMCSTCQVISNDGKSRPAFDNSAVILGGEVLGVRTDKGRLREIFVRRGSSVVFTGDVKDPQTDIVITECDGKETYEELPKPPDGLITTAVVLDKGDTIVGTAYAPSELAFIPPKQ